MSAPSLLHAVSHYRRWAVHSRLHLIASPVWLSLRTIWCIAMYGRMRAQPTAPDAWNRTPSSSPRQMPGSDPLTCTLVRTGLYTSSTIIATPSSTPNGWPRTPITPDIFITGKTAVESTELFPIQSRRCPCLKTFESVKRQTQSLSKNWRAQTSGGGGRLSVCS